MNKWLPASPWDYVTSTDSKGIIRFDARKTFEAGAFTVSTLAFIYLTDKDNLTEWFFFTYMVSWTAARYLRDREQRLSKQINKPSATLIEG